MAREHELPKHYSVDGEYLESGLRIKILGIGGAGTNAVDRIKLDDLEQVHLAVMDTDSQVLASSPVEDKVALGVAGGMGKSAGGNPDYGRRAAEESEARIRCCLEGTDMVFLLAGLGGGTGGGAAPLIAELAVEEGILVVAFVALPFKREGKLREERALASLEQLRKCAHAVITLPNDTVFRQIDPDATLMEAFSLADNYVRLGVHAIWSMLFSTGLMNVDFATLQNALSMRGRLTLFGTGHAQGDNLVARALAELFACPLLQMPDASGATYTDQLVLNLTGGPDLSMGMVNAVMDALAEKFGKDVSIAMGASIDGSFSNQLRITIIGNCKTKAPLKKGFEPVQSASIAPNRPVELKETATSDPVLRNTQRSQEEFAFSSEDANRGLFDKMQRNLHEGIDLDIPTYLRRGIRLPRI